MTTRVLPPEEWPRLEGTLLASVWPTFNPQFAEVIVVEDQAGAIVGSVALLTVLHAECLSITGQAGVARALWKALGERVAAAGGTAVWGAALEAPMQRLLTRHAEAIPGDHFVVRV
jgi:hypothetical protein